MRNSLVVQCACAVLVAGGPALLGWASLAPKPEDTPAGEEQLPFTVFLRDFFSQHHTIQMACFFVPLVTIPATFGVRKLDKQLKFYKSISDEGLIQLLRIFDKVVGQKMELLGTKVKALLPSDNDVDQLNGRLFKTESDQLSQIKALVDGLYTIFRYITEESKCDLKVTLGAIVGKRIDSFIYFLPQDDGPATDMGKLRHDNSGFSICTKHEKLLIIENLKIEHARGQKKPEKRRFVSDDARDGSLLCFPVRHRNLARVLFVISVFSDKNSVFREAERKKYEFVLAPFAKRVLVEYNLLAIQVKKPIGVV